MEVASDCEIQSGIRFFNARNVLPSEIHHQICQVYGDNVMSDGMVRKWVRMFNEGRENVHDEAWMMIWCIRSTKQCVTTDVSQFLICRCTFFRFKGIYSMTVSVVIWVIGKCVHNGCPRCSERSTMGVPYHTGIKTAILALEAYCVAEKKKFKQIVSTRKITCTVFWDRHGVLLVEYLSKTQQ